MRKGLGLRRIAGLTTIAAVAALAIAGFALGVTGAINTTDDPGYSGGLGAPTAACLNGQPGHTDPATNCNIYLAKTDVFLSGSPVSAALGAGTYFFAILVPGGQPDANDGSAKNLSDDFDAWSDREFSVDDGGIITNLGTHALDGATNELQAAPFADTTNPGGVYIMAVCKVPDPPSGSPGVVAKDCKYDAFKVLNETCTEDCGPPPVDDLAIEKDASASFSRQFKWTIVKTVDGSHSVNYNAATKTLSYHVVYTKALDHDFGWEVHGTITVTNPNAIDATGVTVTDVLNDAAPTSCTVADGTYTDGDGNPQTVSAGGTIPALTVVQYTYSCSPPDTSATLNTATVSWDPIGSPDTSKNGTHDVTWPAPTLIHNCVTASDTIAAGGIVGTPPTGSICDSTTFDYTKTVTVANGCITVPNTAAFTDGTYTGNDSTTAQICGPVTGGLTMGFWQNSNGQKIIKAGGTTGGVCNSGTWLRTFLPGPFQDLSATANCNAVATYVYNLIKGAGINCGGTNCNALLKAQMLATALNVYFSAPGLGGNQIGAPTPLGPVMVNITAFKVAFNNQTCLSVLGMLTYAASQSNGSGSSWYGQVKATQERAKSAFDAINNQIAFSC